MANTLNRALYWSEVRVRTAEHLKQRMTYKLSRVEDPATVWSRNGSLYDKILWFKIQSLLRESVDLTASPLLINGRCGYGTYSKYFANRGLQELGIDLESLRIGTKGGDLTRQPISRKEDA